MSSWIYLLSKFTPEALLLEALVICGLVAGYTAFWILRKRKLGTSEEMIPASVVKVYLSELIGEATHLRTELFGLLGGDFNFTPRPVVVTGAPMPAGISLSADQSAKLAELEAKMAQQLSAMEKLLAEKAKLEKELADLRARSTSSNAAPGQAVDTGPLQERIATLEARLAEYSVIEDDLANLKRLQQENSQLKAQLGVNTAATPPPAVAAAPAAPSPPAAAPKPAAVAAAAPAAPAAPVAGAAEPSFESLVDSVEKSLQPDAPASTTPPSPAPAEKTDEDLIAEFEKMLKS